MKKILIKALIIVAIILLYHVLFVLMNMNYGQTGRFHSLSWLPFAAMIYGIYKVIKH